MMFDWIINVVSYFKSKGDAGELEFILAIVIPFLGFLFASYKFAQWRYRKDIADARDLRLQLAVREETLAERDIEISELKTNLTELEAAGPTGFLKAINYKARDGNFDQEVECAENYIDGQRVALHRAFATLAKDAIGYASSEGAAGFENARLFALAGLVVNPSDDALRGLAEELRHAAAIAQSGVKVSLKSEDARAEIQAKRQRLPADLDALETCWLKAREEGQWQLMIAFAEHGLRLARRGGGEASHAALIWNRQLAEAEILVGRAANGLRRCEMALPAFNTVFGPDDRDTLYLRHLIAQCFNNTGDAAKALELAQALLPDQETVKGKDHPGTLATRYLIARCFRDTGDAAKALELAQALLPDQETVNGKDHPDTLTTRHLIAQCFNDTGDAAKALELAQALLPDMETVKGKDHPSTLTTRYLIAQCFNDTGDAAKALELAQALLPDEETVKGKDHPNTLTTRHLIAQCFNDTGDAAKALELAQALLPDEETVKGKDHPNTLATRYLIAQCFKDTGDAAKALELAQALLPDMETVKGKDHPDTLTTRTLIAKCLIELDKFSDASKKHKGVLKSLRALGLKDTHPYVKRALSVDQVLKK